MESLLLLQCAAAAGDAAELEKVILAATEAEAEAETEVEVEVEAESEVESDVTY